MKAAEVRNMLEISDSKLQRLRVKGILSSSKIGGVHYYELARIHSLLQKKVLNAPISKNA
ncbi:helix-turn-helix domain-containing protein [Niabella ginsengisoli]|uniref:Helix-turn-helix domain-containing protein n=1 Tax=Niabella ginsengisoli TaxID=522298 RepID=A0ABS9SHT1_9BACT|nr:helix-turn-helix domain-containing protein [Niabella ginsengisoli]MCH5597924.1 helix-turn-helix domain-containing protein [Niabella ginsengisoli]